jgi:hypothetical protein
LDTRQLCNAFQTFFIRTFSQKWPYRRKYFISQCPGRTIFRYKMVSTLNTTITILPGFFLFSLSSETITKHSLYISLFLNSSNSITSPYGRVFYDNEFHYAFRFFLCTILTPLKAVSFLDPFVHVYFFFPFSNRALAAGGTTHLLITRVIFNTQMCTNCTSLSLFCYLCLIPAYPPLFFSSQSPFVEAPCTYCPYLSRNVVPIPDSHTALIIVF